MVWTGFTPIHRQQSLLRQLYTTIADSRQSPISPREGQDQHLGKTGGAFSGGMLPLVAWRVCPWRHRVEVNRRVALLRAEKPGGGF